MGYTVNNYFYPNRVQTISRTKKPAGLGRADGAIYAGVARTGERLAALWLELGWPSPARHLLYQRRSTSAA